MNRRIVAADDDCGGDGRAQVQAIGPWADVPYSNTQRKDGSRP